MQLYTVCHFVMFSYYIFQSVKRYFHGRTTYHSSVVNVEQVQYPSISVCSKNTFRGNNVTDVLLSNNVSFNDKKMLALENIWKKNELFYFLSHPGISGMRYPCVTLNDGTDPGKPCHFPIR